MRAVRHFVRTYRVPLVAVALAAAHALLFWSLGPRVPLGLFIAAVMVSAWLGGLRPALVATALSTLLLAVIAHYHDDQGLQQIADAYGTPRFEQVFRELYPSCENISIDYAVLEPRSAKGEHHSNIYCLPTDFGWNDLGSWDALYEHQLAQGNAKDGNVTEAKGMVGIDASNNYVYSPGKFVALVGVDDLVVVETEDAMLITTRERSQDVRRVVSELTGKHDELI